MVCERCNKPASVHLTEISNGQRTEVHLCEACAQEVGYIQTPHVPVTEMLNQFLQTQTHMQDKETLRCADCGMTWREFKDTGLLGCAKDYVLFESHLRGVIETAQQGGNHHTGKAAGLKKADAEDAVQLRQAQLRRLQKELATALKQESYEAAAKLRDEIKTLERPG